MGINFNQSSKKKEIDNIYLFRMFELLCQLVCYEIET